MTAFRPPRPLEGRVALVTGASRGIGRGIASRLARDGAHVAVHYATDANAGDETVRQIEAAGGRAFTVGQPFGVERDVESLFERLDAKLATMPSGRRLDVLVNNAGIAIAGTLEAVTPCAYEQQFAVNARAPLFVAQAAARRMCDGGRIVTISSGTTSRALPEWLVYTMTKAAIESMTRIVASELAARGITVNAVAAGIVDTDMNAGALTTEEQRAEAASVAALGRIGSPEDIADVVAFLASDDARWVTGHVLDASGGSFL